MARRGSAVALTLLCSLAILSLFIAALWFAADTVAQKALQYGDEFDQTRWIVTLPASVDEKSQRGAE